MAAASAAAAACAAGAVAAAQSAHAAACGSTAPALPKRQHRHCQRDTRAWALLHTTACQPQPHAMRHPLRSSPCEFFWITASPRARVRLKLEQASCAPPLKPPSTTACNHTSTARPAACNLQLSRQRVSHEGHATPLHWHLMLPRYGASGNLDRRLADTHQAGRPQPSGEHVQAVPRAGQRSTPQLRWKIALV